MRAAQRRWAPFAAAVAAATLLVAWTPASDEGTETTAPASADVQTDPAELGEITLTVWDQEVRGGQNEQIESLNAAFMEGLPQHHDRSCIPLHRRPAHDAAAGVVR
jgi:raffinose/stachyose/melibiose transport system substrate-binding protein